MVTNYIDYLMSLHGKERLLTPPPVGWEGDGVAYFAPLFIKVEKVEKVEKVDHDITPLVSLNSVCISQF